MATKIYRKNNYLLIIDDVNNTYFEEHYSNVIIKKVLASDTEYTVSCIRENGIVQNFYKVKFADIRQENNTSYASISAWEEWYTANTGFMNSGSVSSDVNANLKVGGSNVSNTNPVPVNIISGGGTTQTASVEVYRVTGTTAQAVAANALSVSVQNLGNFNVNVTTDVSTGVAIDAGVSVTWDAPAGYKLPAYSFVNSNVSGVFLLTVVR